MGLTWDEAKPVTDLIGDEPSLPLEGETLFVQGPRRTDRTSVRQWFLDWFVFAPGDMYLPVRRRVRIEDGLVTVTGSGKHGGSQVRSLRQSFTLHCRILFPHASVRLRGGPSRLGRWRFAVVLRPLSEGDAASRDIVLCSSRSVPFITRRFYQAADLLGMDVGTVALPADPAPPLAERAAGHPDPDGLFDAMWMACESDESLTTFRIRTGENEGGRKRWYASVIGGVGTYGLAFAYDLVGDAVFFLGLLAFNCVIWHDVVVRRLTSPLELRFDERTVQLVRTYRSKVISDWSTLLSRIRDVRVVYVPRNRWAVLLVSDDGPELFGASGQLKLRHAELIRDVLLERLQYASRDPMSAE